MWNRLCAGWVMAALLALALAACGGGGGGGGGGSPPPAGSAPTITSQPASQSVNVGASASFSVTATGDAPLSYQWLRDGVAIPGATAQGYTTPATVLADDGASFTVTVTNSVGSVTSAAAILRVTTNGTGPARASKLGSGYGYSLAVRADGTVVSWGAGMFGGSGVAIAGTALKTVNGLSGIASVAAGDAILNASYAIGADGTLRGWGYSLFGELGVKQLASPIDTPIAVASLGTVSAVANCNNGTALSQTIALRSDGTVWIAPGTLVSTDGGLTYTETVKQVPGLTGVAALSDHGHDCTHLAIKTDGTVWSVTTTATIPSVGTTQFDAVATQVAGLAGIASASCAAGLGDPYFCLARTTDGHVWAWGTNNVGQLGDGTTTGRTIPFQIAGLSDIKQVTAGVGVSYALANDGSLFSWGGGSGAILPALQFNGVNQTTPKLLPGLTNVVELAIDELSFHALVRLNDGSVWGWGSNQQGELGDGTTGNYSATPVRVLGLNLN